MIAAVSLIALGFFLGMRHATDPDHVIAIGAIVARERTLRGGIVIGALWGLGHTVTIITVGGAIILFSLVIPSRVGLTMEMTVALMLVALGVWNVSGPLRALHGRRAEGGPVHAHPAWLDRLLGGMRIYYVMRPLVVGVVHGLAGSAAIALLVLATIGEPRWAFAYLVLFGVGTIVGMMMITFLIAAPLAYAGPRLPRMEPHMRLWSGLLSVGLGLVLAYHIASALL